MKNKIGLIILLLVLLLPSVARAGFVDLDITEFVVEGLQKLINIFVNFIGGTLVTLAGSIVNYVYGFPSFITAPVVQVGWTITRDLANMTFILGMLAIAFATILRMDIFGFNLKKTLPKLIAMALLLNFSLVVCGAIIDVGNSLGKFFVNGGRAQESAFYKNDIGANIMAAVSAGQIAQLRNHVSSNIVTNLLMSSVMQLTFYVILAFLLFAMGFIMIFRIVNLWLLIILAPLAWVCSFLPKMDSYYSSWWKKFLQWSFVPAVMGFFIYLGLIVGATFMGSDFTRTTDVGGAWEKVLPETPIAAVMQFIVVVFILFMGLHACQSWGVSGAQTMMKLAESSKKWAMGKIKVVSKAIPGAAYRGVDKATGGRLDTKVSRFKAERLSQLEKMPVIGRALGGPGTSYAAQQKALGEAANKTSKLRPNDIEARLNQAALTPEGLAERAGMIKNLIDKGQFSLDEKMPTEWLNMLQTLQNHGGNVLDLIKKRPDLALNEDVQGMIGRDVNSPQGVKDKWNNISTLATPEDKELAIHSILNSDIFKTAADIAGIQKEAFDMKGKLDATHRAQYEDVETRLEDRPRGITSGINELKTNRETEANRNEAEIKDLQAQLTEAKRLNTGGVNNASIANLEHIIEGMASAEKNMMRTYQEEMKNLMTQQILISGRAGQKMLLNFLNEQAKKQGNLTTGHLNSLASKNKAAHLEAMKYLSNMAPGMKGEWKDTVYKQVITNETLYTMPDPFAAPPPPAGP